MEQMFSAIDYAHLHGRKLYMTVNTLLKNIEIERQLTKYIRPFYEQGLDAVIVQDLGVMTLEDAFLKITMGEGVKLSSEKSSAPAAEKSAAPAAETTAPEEPAAAPAEAEKAETPAEDAAQKQEGGEA